MKNPLTLTYYIGLIPFFEGEIPISPGQIMPKPRQKNHHSSPVWPTSQSLRSAAPPPSFIQ
jgi:hypothetical protein